MGFRHAYYLIAGHFWFWIPCKGRSIYSSFREGGHNQGTNASLFSECPNNLCRDVQKEDGTNEGKGKD